MKYFDTNSTQPKLKTFDGKKYLVVPVVMAKAGVEMNGGVINEDQFHAESWNGVPVTYGHPKDSSGNDISANSPDVLEKWSVGQIFNAKVEDGSLKAEAWVNVEKANEIDDTLIARLQAMDNIDVSTGYFSELENNEYKNIKPNHLALLPNEVGACSFDDGCGVRSNSFLSKIMTNLRKNFGSNIPKDIEMRLNESGYLEIAEQLHSVINDMNYGNTYHYVVDVFDNDFIYAKDGDGEIEYYRRDYTMNEGKIELGEKQQVQKEINYKPITNGVNMIDELIANDASPFTADDKETLEAFSEDKIKALAEKYKEPKGEEKTKTNSKEDAPKESVLSNEDKEALELARQSRTEKREEYITHITANSAMKPCELEKLDTNVLKSIASGIKPAPDYSGRSFGANNEKTSDEDVVKAMTPMSTAEYIQNKRKEVN